MAIYGLILDPYVVLSIFFYEKFVYLVLLKVAGNQIPDLYPAVAGTGMGKDFYPRACLRAGKAWHRGHARGRVNGLAPA